MSQEMQALYTVLLLISCCALCRTTLLKLGPLNDALKEQEKCERIQVKLCQDAPYNYTRLPNILSHHTQDMVSAAMEEYRPLIEVKCSPHLKFFLCSAFTPMCTENVDAAIMSCRSVCEEVKRGCLPLLTSFGFKWPEMLHCSKFPAKGTGVLCMDPIPDSAQGAESEHSTRVSENGNKGGDETHESKSGESSVHKSCAEYYFSEVPSVDGSKQLVMNCGKDWMFKGDHKSFMDKWMASWSIVCIVVTAFTVITFCLDTGRFRYPERSIIFLSVCYNLYAWAYVLRLIFGATDSSCQAGKSNEKALIANGLDNPKCVMIFMILYYFGTAGAIWWVVLTFTWFLAAGWKWGQEAIAAVSSYFHLAAWGLPALLTIAVLITRQVDASELTGLCFVGQRNSKALLGFVIAPMTVCLIAGLCFIVAGFVAMVRIRQEMRSRSRVDSNDLNKLEKLMVKIGIFSVLYILPALTVIGCSFYEKTILDAWTPDAFVAFAKSANATQLLFPSPSSTPPSASVVQLPDADDSQAFPHRTPSIDYIRTQAHLQFEQYKHLQQQQQQLLSITLDPEQCLQVWSKVHAKPPRMDIYVLKIFMILIVGITSGMWVWSRKTCATWQKRVPCCGCACLNGPTKVVVQYQPACMTAGPAAAGMPLLTNTGHPLQQQHSQMRHHYQHHQPTASSHHHMKKNNHYSSHNAAALNMPMKTFSNADGVLYATTASSDASERI